jgi:hypothetical protein
MGPLQVPSLLKKKKILFLLRILSYYRPFIDTKALQGLHYFFKGNILAMRQFVELWHHLRTIHFESNKSTVAAEVGYI